MRAVVCLSRFRSVVMLFLCLSVMDRSFPFSQRVVAVSFWGKHLLSVTYGTSFLFFITLYRSLQLVILLRNSVREATLKVTLDRLPIAMLKSGGIDVVLQAAKLKIDRSSKSVNNIWLLPLMRDNMAKSPVSTYFRVEVIKRPVFGSSSLFLLCMFRGVNVDETLCAAHGSDGGRTDTESRRGGGRRQRSRREEYAHHCCAGAWDAVWLLQGSDRCR